MFTYWIASHYNTFIAGFITAATVSILLRLAVYYLNKRFSKPPKLAGKNEPRAYPIYIVLLTEDFNDLIKGIAINKGSTKIILEDIGFNNMHRMLDEAQNLTNKEQ